MTTSRRSVKIISLKNKACLADQCLVAESFFSRLKGLLGCKSLLPGEGLFLQPCNDIHMWFMSISIDVIFIQKQENLGQASQEYKNVYRVTSFRPSLPPWKLLPVRDGAAIATLELPPGTIDRCGVRVGDLLCIN